MNVIDEIKRMDEAKNIAYSERNQLVAALSKVFPSYLGKHPEDPIWDAEWMNIVFIELPTGQCSWHIHDDELKNFSHLKLNPDAEWDGHTTEEKYLRVKDLRPTKDLPTMDEVVNDRLDRMEANINRILKAVTNQ